MFGTSYGSRANAYAQVGVETGVVAASPHKLIVMLFDGAIAALLTAQQNMQPGNINIEAKGKALSHAITIIEGGLRASLDKNTGGEIAENLDSLYDYMSRRLLLANVKNDVSILTEVHALLKDLRAAWEAIDPSAQATQADAPAPVVQDPFAPATPRLVKA